MKKLLYILSLVMLGTLAQAQVKIGSNPGTITTNAVLDVEGTSGSHSVILQNGDMGIGTTTVASTTANSGQTLEVNSGTNNLSGLRFSQLKSTSNSTQGSAPLGINSDGDVVLMQTAAAAKLLYVGNGVSIGSGVSLTSSNWNNWNNTGTTITIPALSKYLVSTVQTIGLSGGTANTSMWLHMSLSSTGGSTYTALPSSPSTSQLFLTGAILYAGSISGEALFSNINGSLIVTNPTSSPQTLYLFTKYSGGSFGSFTGTLINVGGAYLETQLYGIPLNQ